MARSQEAGIRLLGGSTGNKVNRNTLYNNRLDGILLVAATGNTLVENESTDNTRSGIRLENSSSDNTQTSNVMKLNTDVDAFDDNRDANTWVTNVCRTDFPDGTICGVG